MTDSPTWPHELLVASRNVGKLRELRPIFGRVGIRVVDLKEAGLGETAAEETLESYDTFTANALAKARYFHALSGGRPTVADDSGLEVDALGGLPGVRSKRYAGVDGVSKEVDSANNALLVRQLATVPAPIARFVCAAAYVDAAREISALGTVTGRISAEPVGLGGFGYDPHFYADELGMTFAQATLEQKERVSHRARAFAALLRAMRRGIDGERRQVDGSA